MNVHNANEELVINRVNELYNQVKAMDAHWLTCDCEHCRLDAISYVLNRNPPRYVVSGRGIIHNSIENDTQLKADIDALIIEAMHIISSVKRPYHEMHVEKPIQAEGPFYNFPTFFGAVYDGNSFESLGNAQVTLKLDNYPAQMIDYTWSNPYYTADMTKAAYSFLVKPQKAEKENISSVFVFTLEVHLQGYDSVSYSFSVPLISEGTIRSSSNSTYSLKIQDLFLFPSNTENLMDD